MSIVIVGAVIGLFVLVPALGGSKLAREALFLIVFVFAQALVTIGVARADDLAGLWATNAEHCQKIFTRNGQGFAFADDADLYGSGFIIDGRRIISKMARCDIKSSKQDGPTTHLIAACATDIMLSNVQASFKMLSKDRMLRIFPGVSDLEIPFERCALN